MDVAELKRQVEYKFAPEPLLAVQAFANTFAFENDEEEEERLTDPESTRRWLVESDLAVAGVEVDEGAHERLLRFRGLIRDLLQTNLEPDHHADAAALAQVAAEHPVPMTVAEDGSIGVDLSPVSAVDGLIGQALGIVADSQTKGEWRRLKICASDECRWAFYDASKNRGGTWCRMEECGNRVKNRRYRERQADRG